MAEGEPETPPGKWALLRQWAYRFLGSLVSRSQEDNRSMSSMFDLGLSKTDHSINIKFGAEPKLFILGVVAVCLKAWLAYRQPRAAARILRPRRPLLLLRTPKTEKGSAMIWRERMWNCIAVPSVVLVGVAACMAFNETASMIQEIETTQAHEEELGGRMIREKAARFNSGCSGTM